MEKVMSKAEAPSNSINDLFTALINTFVIAFSLIGIWAFSCLVGGLFVSAGRALMPFFSV
jgi:hypothetical protein